MMNIVFEFISEAGRSIYKTGADVAFETKEFVKDKTTYSKESLVDLNDIGEALHDVHADLHLRVLG